MPAVPASRAASTGCRTGPQWAQAAGQPGQASGRPLVWSFPDLTTYLDGITHRQGRHNPPWAGSGSDQMGNNDWLSSTRLVSKHSETCNPLPRLPRNPHVAFHIPNLGVTLRLPLRCLTWLDFLPDLALALASRQRNKRSRMNQNDGRRGCSTARHLKDMKHTPVSPHTAHPPI